MSKFKEGDRVLWNNNSQWAGTVFSTEAYGAVVHFDQGAKCYYSDNTLSLIKDPIAEAKDLLEQNGFTVTEPKPKLTGKVVIYCWHRDFKSPLCVDEATWNRNFKWTPERKDLQRIAIVDWTEGQGL